MNYKPEEATLISYLYGELEGDELRKVEEYLARHPEEKKRMDEWIFARSAMSRLEDKEVIAPPIILEGAQRSIWKETYIRMSLGIAASFLIVLVAARLLGLSASYTGNELTIGFGKREKPLVQPLSEEEVGKMIHSSLAKNNEALQSNWTEERKALESSIGKNLNSNSDKIDRLMKTASTANEEQVRRFVSQMQGENLKLMKDYLQLSTEGQREYVETLLVDFSKYLQEQRNQDLQLFQTRMNSLQQNNDQFKQETEQILTGLISRTGVPNQNQN